MLFAAVHNALKRKFNALQEIYAKLADRRANRLSQTLEMIIIILIVLEIILY